MGPRGHEEENRTQCLISNWKRCVLPGKRDQVAWRLLLQQVWIYRALLTPPESVLYETGRHVRALVAYSTGDRMVHVISLYGFSGAGERQCTVNATK